MRLLTTIEAPKRPHYNTAAKAPAASPKAIPPIAAVGAAPNPVLLLVVAGSFPFAVFDCEPGDGEELDPPVVAVVREELVVPRVSVSAGLLVAAVALPLMGPGPWVPVADLVKVPEPHREDDAADMTDAYRAMSRSERSPAACRQDSQPIQSLKKLPPHMHCLCASKASGSVPLGVHCHSMFSTETQGGTGFDKPSGLQTWLLPDCLGLRAPALTVTAYQPRSATGVAYCLMVARLLCGRVCS
ncbi:hypothetical protein PoMZ_08458 [Pyricularia oryzae]|uniref:Uncharacterized protein n=1 Tax=Pyricularia oryzae TaxID=318829 RepID=A0A4P7NHR4_PYROR|nr:hypothetical protein PoMZ_08458 [Pyricularia oryzae]